MVECLPPAPSLFQEWSASGVDQYWHSTIDFQPPSLASISAGIKIIDAAKQRRHGVYVHCKAGKGRSAIVVACYLMKVTKLIIIIIKDSLHWVRAEDS